MRATVRNVLIGGGVYYLSWWLAYPLAFGYGKLTGWINYRDNFGVAVAMPVVVGLPYALVAAGVGAAVVWLVESQRPFYWAIFPAALYGYFAFVGHHWLRRPTSYDRLGQIIGAVFLASACLVGAMIAVHRRTSSNDEPNSR
jgi:hypothetical protein